MTGRLPSGHLPPIKVTVWGRGWVIMDIFGARVRVMYMSAGVHDGDFWGRCTGAISGGGKCRTFRREEGRRRGREVSCRPRGCRRLGRGCVALRGRIPRRMWSLLAQRSVLALLTAA